MNVFVSFYQLVERRMLESTFRQKVFYGTDEKPMIAELTNISWDNGQGPSTVEYVNQQLESRIGKAAYYVSKPDG